jgi:hypothetical protein
MHDAYGLLHLQPGARHVLRSWQRKPGVEVSVASAAFERKVDKLCESLWKARWGITSTHHLAWLR